MPQVYETPPNVEGDRLTTHRVTGLGMSIDIAVVRVKRRRCPRCGNVRVLFRLSAFGASPIGDGPLLCGPCGGLR